MEFVLPTSGGQPSAYEELFRDFLYDRTLFFNAEVNDDMVEDIVMYIIRWNKEDKDLPIEKRKPIKIYISSVGGDSFVSMNVVDVIMQSKTPIIGIALSLVASAAYYIYLACHERIAFQNSILLQHDGSVTVSNSTRKATQTMSFFQNREQDIKDFVLSRTTMDSDFYDSIFDSEYYMDVNRAKELGVVKQVIGKDIDFELVL